MGNTSCAQSTGLVRGACGCCTANQPYGLSHTSSFTSLCKVGCGISVGLWFMCMYVCVCVCVCMYVCMCVCVCVCVCSGRWTALLAGLTCSCLPAKSHWCSIQRSVSEKALLTPLVLAFMHLAYLFGSICAYTTTISYSHMTLNSARICVITIEIKRATLFFTAIKGDVFSQVHFGVSSSSDMRAVSNGMTPRVIY